MKGYLVCFISSIIFIFISEKLYLKGHKKFSTFFFLISFFIPCIISGVRSLDVGTDIKSYFSVLFYNYTQNNMNFFKGMKIANVELGYALIIYLASKTENINFCLFINQLLVSLPIYILAYNLRKDYNSEKKNVMTFTVIVYLLTLYSMSMNLMRQSIAISIGVLMYYYLQKGNKKIAYLLFILACTFHASALSLILVFIINEICFKYKKNRILHLFILLLLLIFFSLTFEKILSIIPSKYSYYLGSKYDINSFSILSLIKKMVWIIPSLVFLSRIKDKNSENYSKYMIICSFLIIDLILYFMSMQLGPAGRLGYYFLYIGYFFMIPYIDNLVEKSGRWIIDLIIILILILFWYNMTVTNSDENETYPYKSDVINQLNEKGD